MDTEELESRVEQIISSLKNTNGSSVVGGYVPPYIGGSEIKIVIIGQDPTVRNPKSRAKIACTLNLDKKGALRLYVEKICEQLGITLENVYATNLFKYFYAYPPANYFEILKNHLPLNLELLKEELSDLKIPVDCPIITLGEPVLRLLLEEKGMSGKEKKVRYYWDYNSTTKSSARYFRFVDESNNALSYKFYPFCHQPSMRKQFYKATFRDYLNFIKGFSV